MNHTPLEPSSISQARRTWRCPSDELLGAYAEHQLDEMRCGRVESHVSNCEFCMSQLGFLLKLQDEPLPEVPAALMRRVRTAASESALRPRLWRWAPIAATVASLVLVTSVLLRNPSMPPPVGPSSAAKPVSAPTIPQSAPSTPTAKVDAGTTSSETRTRSPQAAVPRLVEPRPGAVLAVDQVAFHWTPVKRSLYYELRVATSQGALVWKTRVETDHVRLPADQHLSPGEVYFAWVRAYLPEGKTVRAEATPFRVKQ
jgi:hypothetical protein